MRAEPRVLVLDFGGVISRTLFETHDMTEKALDLPSGTLTWRGPFAPETDALWQSMQAGKISERDYWMARTVETGQRIGKTWTRMEEFVRAARGAEPDAIIRPEFRCALKCVKQAGLLTAILSNELDLFYGADFRGKLPFLTDFDCIIDATHTGILKPDARAYLAICEALSVPPAKCVLVDDQVKNINGAITVGMIPVHFDVREPQKSYAEALSHFGLPLPVELSA